MPPIPSALRRLCRWFFVLSVPVLLSAGVRAATAAPPNVVVFIADDQGWGDVGLNGNPWLETPHIDSLARDGVRFERFYVQPVCAPTRAEFLTGRFHPRGGVAGVSRGEERLDRDERTIADDFRAAGYATGLFGKWHNGTQWPYHPNARGFDEFYGYTSGHWGSYFDPMLDHNGELVTGRGFLADDLTDHAMAFLTAQHEAGRPFFTVVTFNTPHSPMQVPEAYWARFAGEDFSDHPHRYSNEVELDHARAALAMCANLDDNVGRVLQRLEDLQLSEDTVVLYFSDNGPNGWRWNDNLRGRKGSTDEGGVRSLLHVRWPAGIPAGRSLAVPAAAIDLLPTLAELTGTARPHDRRLDGTSLAGLLRGDGAPPPDRPIFAHWNGRSSVRHTRYLLDDRGRLYDLAADPGQNHELTAAQPETAAALATELAQWEAAMAAEPRDGAAFVVGDPGDDLTQLPARDAEGQGGIERSAQPPNCSFFTQWTSTADAITWDVDVARAGTYAVELYYACPPADVGATIELSCGDARLVTTLTEPHDPPLRGAEHDRAPRVESYVKTFAPWSMGEITLPQGHGVLRLRAQDIPGEQAMEVRLLLLRYRP